MRRILLACVATCVAVGAFTGCGENPPKVNNEEALKKELKELNEARKKEGTVAK